MPPLESSLAEPPLPRAQPNRARSAAAVAALAFHALVSLVVLLALTQRIILLRRVGAHAPVAREALLSSDAFVAAATRMHVFAFIAAGVCFLAWLYRANKNLRAFQSGPFEFSPAYAVGSFFIPVVNLAQPFFAMKEIWQGSYAPPSGDGPYTETKVTPLVAIWWFLFLGQGVLGWVALIPMMGEHSVTSLLTASTILCVSCLIGILGAMAASVLILRIQRQQGTLSRLAPDVLQT